MLNIQCTSHIRSFKAIIHKIRQLFVSDTNLGPSWGTSVPYMWLKWKVFCLGKRRTRTGFSLRGRRKKEKAKGREKSAKKRENPLSPIPLFFPFLPIPCPFRRLTGLGYAIRFEAHDKSGIACLGGGGGVTPRNFWWGSDKKSLFLHPFSDLLQRQKLRHHYLH